MYVYIKLYYNRYSLCSVFEMWSQYECAVRQRQTVVAAYFSSRQLLLFVFDPGYGMVGVLFVYVWGDDDQGGSSAWGVTGILPSSYRVSGQGQGGTYLTSLAGVRRTLPSHGIPSHWTAYREG